jgi:hypothetical protein
LLLALMPASSSADAVGPFNDQPVVKDLVSYVQKLKGKVGHSGITKAEKVSMREKLKGKAAAATDLTNARLAARDAADWNKNEAGRQADLELIAADNADAVAEINDYWDGEVELVVEDYNDQIDQLRGSYAADNAKLKRDIKSAKRDAKHAKKKRAKARAKHKAESLARKLEANKGALEREIASLNSDCDNEIADLEDQRNQELADQDAWYASDVADVNATWDASWTKLHAKNAGQQKDEAKKASDLLKQGLGYIEQM